jgi:hypothetical protein
MSRESLFKGFSRKKHPKPGKLRKKSGVFALTPLAKQE